jgi:hypothetical protein
VSPSSNPLERRIPRTDLPRGRSIRQTAPAAATGPRPAATRPPRTWPYSAVVRLNHETAGCLTVVRPPSRQRSRRRRLEPSPRLARRCSHADTTLGMRLEQLHPRANRHRGSLDIRVRRSPRAAPMMPGTLSTEPWRADLYPHRQANFTTFAGPAYVPAAHQCIN